MPMQAPVIITPGDPASISPEIALKALMAEPHLRQNAVIMGQIGHLQEVAQQCELDVRFTPWQAGDQLSEDAISIYEITWPIMPLAGKPDLKNAPVIISAIETAVEMTNQGAASAIVTCPIAKAHLYEAGFAYPGHTEFLGALSGGKSAVMMLANKQLRVVPATIHIPLADVSTSLSADALCTLILQVADALLTDFNITEPHIALCGLNPHAGESGKMGNEEDEIIAPALKLAQERLATKALLFGTNLSGPHAADSLFHHDKLQHIDCVIGMYHDQVLIPVKTLDFHGSVNITLGLDFVRTSPDHGTAFDIAGHNIARPDSLINALYTAEEMARNRQDAAKR